MRRATMAALIVGLLALPAVPAQAADSLISRNKPVTVSSSQTSAQSGALAVDGDLSTRWASTEGHDPEWIKIDLGSFTPVSRVVLKWDAAYGKAYRIELSNDNRTWRTAYRTTLGDGATDDLWLTGSGRYIRLYGTQRGTERGYSLREFQVYGSAIKRSSWQLSWQDEFNEAAGTRPNSSKWVYNTGGEPRWGNKEWQYYTNRPQNVSTDGQGNLAITARRERLPGMANCPYGTCDITSARITTMERFEQAYGKFEARIKVPAGQGLWPAFWMMGNDSDTIGWPKSGEIDVMEIVGKEPSTLYGTLHGPIKFGRHMGAGGFTKLPGGAKFADDFHVFAVEWSPEQITWTLDGTPYLSMTKSQRLNGMRWVFDHPFYMLLNLAVGGGWPGPPNEQTKFPATLLVDYVRVYTKA